jgi:hypothetical protein
LRVVRSLRGDRNQRGAKRLNLVKTFLVSLQLQVTVRSPGTSVEGCYHRAERQAVG